MILTSLALGAVCLLWGQMAGVCRSAFLGPGKRDERETFPLVIGLSAVHRFDSVDSGASSVNVW